VSNEDDVESLFDAAEGPSVLVCAAGILERLLIEETTPELWRRTIDVNLTGAFLCCRRAFTAMRAAGGGRIVTIASLSGVYATEKFPGLAAYNVSKYGVVGLTEAVAVEGRDHGISAVCISPGAVDTEMLRQAAPHLKPGLGPHDVGRLIVQLLNGEFDAMSGANIPLFSNR
jgi:NAD(P)-dependent dehydrogenase (short-subunit alcohol dehydrogenase family)